MNFLLEIKLRQEAARRYNPVRETKKFERIIKRRSNWKKIFSNNQIRVCSKAREIYFNKIIAMNAQQKRLKNTSGLSLHHHSIWLYFGLSILKRYGHPESSSWQK